MLAAVDECLSSGTESVALETQWMTPSAPTPSAQLIGICMYDSASNVR